MLKAAGIPETAPVHEVSGKLTLPLVLLVTSLSHHPDSPRRGNGDKREGDFCIGGCSPSPCLSLSGFVGVSASSPAPLPAGLMSSRGGGSGELADCTAFPSASHWHLLRSDSSKQIMGERLR